MVDVESVIDRMYDSDIVEQVAKWIYEYPGRLGSWESVQSNKGEAGEIEAARKKAGYVISKLRSIIITEHSEAMAGEDL